MSRSRIVTIAVAACIACAALGAGASRILELAQTTRKLLPVPFEIRREMLLGAYYPAVRELRRTFPSRQSIDVIWRGHPDIDTAIFTNYYLYPRVRRFSQLDAWRATPRRPEEPLLWIDTRTSPQPRLVTYLEARRENGREKFRSATLRNSWSVAKGRVIVPLVCSIDGAPPDEYVVPVLIENDAPDAARVRLSYRDRDGWAEQREITIPSRGRFFTDDILGDLFGRMGIGWLEAEFTVPVHIGASLLNRGRGSASALRVASPSEHGAIASGTLHFKGDPAKLYFINPADGWATLDVDASASGRKLSIRIQLAPFELRTIDDPATRIAGIACADCPWSVTYRADRPVFAYASRQDSAEATHFVWTGASR